MTNWIKCGDIKPEEYVDILISDGFLVDAGYRIEGIGEEKDLYFSREWIIENITHWMPLPEPPRDVDE